MAEKYNLFSSSASRPRQGRFSSPRQEQRRRRRRARVRAPRVPSGDEVHREGGRLRLRRRRAGGAHGAAACGAGGGGRGRGPRRLGALDGCARSGGRAGTTPTSGPASSLQRRHPRQDH
ncbi:hypothetical protein GQ55_2G090700 [Panicum hallii var. hallii]|uniref:Uncharacterized protein n=1 Tax=Panicum hallii var. hallii TaxID=1504633 RepID=A0A2T7EN07_9POAL|nr:hypothetical protein GQ55_2G090700 [Panicum hallii var. hallii]